MTAARRLAEKELDRHACDGWLDRMWSVEFDVAHVVARGLQPGCVRAAAGFDGQLLVGQAVRDEHLGRTFLCEDRHEATGERNHMTRDIAVRDADRQCVE